MVVEQRGSSHYRQKVAEDPTWRLEISKFFVVLFIRPEIHSQDGILQFSSRDRLGQMKSHWFLPFKTTPIYIQIIIKTFCQDKKRANNVPKQSEGNTII